MQRLYSDLSAVLNPKQPEFVLVTSDYSKKPLAKYNIAHFYQFTAETNRMNVIPDACVDLLFWRKNGKLITKIAGSRLEKGETDADPNSEYFGVRFMPGVNPVDKNLSLSEIVNHEWDFEDMLSYDEKEPLLESLFFTNSFDDKINIFMSYCLKKIEHQSEDTKSLKYFVRNEIIKSNGNLKLSDLSTMTGYSERYLNNKNK